MQTILGAGGAIGVGLAKLLPEFTERVRLVSRNPTRVNPYDDLVAANLLERDEVMKAVAGSDVAYLVAGLPYKTSVWQEQWPRVMRNTIDACSAEGCRLVFFDNIYMYDRDALSPMDENTPVHPTSGKGKVRAEIAEMLMNAVERGEIKALIARSADFYGPGRQQNSVLTQTVFDRISAGKSGQWLMSADHMHSFTYTPDAARATAMLGNAADAFGSVWHLPTASDPLTGRGWIEAIAGEFGVDTKVQVAGNFLISLMGLFVPAMRELKEMVYQYDRDYVFVSDRFNTRFDFQPTSYASGIKAVVAADYQ